MKFVFSTHITEVKCEMQLLKAQDEDWDEEEEWDEDEWEEDEEEEE